MLIEILGVLICVGVLALIGIGPMLFFLAGSEKRIQRALGLAPVMGLVVVGILGFPMVRYIGPVIVWVWPATGVLILASLGLVARDYQHNRTAYIETFRSISIVPPVIFILLSYLLLFLPMAVGGIQYSIYRTNSSDAFVYTSLAETVRVVAWPILVRGQELTNANLDGVLQLAAASPTALFSARLIAAPIALNHVTTIAWMAQVAGTSVHRFFYAYNLLAFALTLPAALTLNDLITRNQLLKYVGAAAIGLGFWAKFILETDAGAQIATLPVLVLVAYFLIRLEQRATLYVLPRERVLLSLASTVIVCFYIPLAPIVALAFVVYYGVGLIHKPSSRRSILYHGLTAFLVLVVLAVTGQLDYYIRNAIYAASVVDPQKVFDPIVLRLLQSDGLSAVWGMPASIIPPSLPPALQTASTLALGGVAVVVTLIMFMAAVVVFRNDALIAERVIFAFVISGVILVGLFYGSSNQRAAGKAFTYVYCFFMLGALILPNQQTAWLNPTFRKSLIGVIGLWLLSQVWIAIQTPVRVSRGTGLQTNGKYDVTVIEDYLATHPPKILLVDIPRTYAWEFAFYSQFVFGKYQTYFQRGLVLDNSIRYQNMWLESPNQVPDYAVVLRANDYIGPEGLGSKVAQAGDLILYRITSGDLAPFLRKEEEYRQADLKNLIFPTLAMPSS